MLLAWSWSRFFLLQPADCIGSFVTLIQWGFARGPRAAAMTRTQWQWKCEDLRQLWFMASRRLSRSHVLGAASRLIRQSWR
ncbi:uncharacterized protein BDV14DRAFT_182053 [Aspergillus stella-maris]|uniref:uncharacterized protein n=1 Tax=Aspergillus stella-maris TaxID=1810926 RepID=UPI003CCDF8D5